MPGPVHHQTLLNGDRRPELPPRSILDELFGGPGNVRRLGRNLGNWVMGACLLFAAVPLIALSVSPRSGPPQAVDSAAFVTTSATPSTQIQATFGAAGALEFGFDLSRTVTTPAMETTSTARPVRRQRLRASATPTTLLQHPLTTVFLLEGPTPAGPTIGLGPIDTTSPPPTPAAPATTATVPATTATTARPTTTRLATTRPTTVTRPATSAAVTATTTTTTATTTTASATTTAKATTTTGSTDSSSTASTPAPPP